MMSSRGMGEEEEEAGKYQNSEYIASISSQDGNVPTPIYLEFVGVE
jgi:hypothetical protein